MSGSGRAQSRSNMSLPPYGLSPMLPQNQNVVMPTIPTQNPLISHSSPFSQPQAQRNFLNF